MTKYIYKKQLVLVSSYLRIFAIIYASFTVGMPLYGRTSPIKRIERVQKICTYLEQDFAKTHSKQTEKKLQEQQVRLENLKQIHKNFSENLEPFLHAPIQQLKEDGALSVYKYYKNRNDQFMQLKLLERLVQVATDQVILADALLALADLYYSFQHNLEKAAQTYEKFASLFPGAVQADYATYKSIVCLFYSTLSAERDQTSTAHAITLAAEFIKKTKNKTYQHEIQDILNQAYERLYNSEKSIFNFYIKQKKWAAAQKRLTYMQEKFVDKVEKAKKELPILEEYLHFEQLPKNQKKTLQSPLIMLDTDSKGKKSAAAKAQQKKNRKFL